MVVAAHSRQPVRWACAAALCALTLPRSAQAGNEDELLIGNHASMTGGAVAATVRDGSALWHNPAGLGASERSSVDVSATGYTLRYYAADRFIATAGGQSQRGSLTEFVVAPTQVAYVTKLGQHSSVGVGYFIPRATSFVLSERLDVQTTDPASVWTFDVSLAESSQAFGAAVGSALSPRLRWGATLFAVYDSFLAAASLFGAVEQGGTTTKLNQFDAIATEADVGAELAIGAQLDVTPRLTLAAALRSPRLRLWHQNDISLRMSSAQQSPGGTMQLASDAPHIPSRGASFELSQAGRYRLALAYLLDAGFISVEGDVMPPFEDTSLNVKRDLTWNLRAGFYRPLTDAVAIGAGVFTDRTPFALSPDAVITRSGNFYGGSLGMELTTRHGLANDEPADELVLTTVFAVRYAYSDSQSTGVLGDPDADVENLISRQLVQLDIHELGLYVGSALRF